MPTRKPKLSLVLPCYNESEHLLDSATTIFNTLNQSKLPFELIFIDDKSKDNTVEIIKQFKRGKSNVRAYYHTNNQGRGATVKEGILKSKGIVVGYIDVDLEVSPEYITAIANKILEGNADVIIGRRHYTINLWPASDILRTVLSIGYTFLVQRLLHLPIHDTESGYKFFNRERISDALALTQNPHWFWDTEICIQSYLNGLSVQEHNVLFLRREDKTSTVKLVPDTIAFFKSLVSFKNEINRKWKDISPGYLYKFPRLYGFAMKTLYGENEDSAYLTIAKLVGKEAKVTDICCGDAKLNQYLTSCKYIGVDSSPSFAFHAIAEDIPFLLADVQNTQIPKADYVIMQRALYQFKNPKKILNNMLKSASKGVIISESINNVNHTNSGFLKGIIGTFVGTNTKDKTYRFTEKEFKALLKEYKPKYRYIKGKRDVVAVIYK